MEIKTINKSIVHFVETDEKDYYQYTRYGSDSWFVRMGESDEPVFDCKEIEAKFQQLNSNTNG